MKKRRDNAVELLIELYVRRRFTYSDIFVALIVASLASKNTWGMQVLALALAAVYVIVTPVLRKLILKYL